MIDINNTIIEESDYKNVNIRADKQIIKVPVWEKMLLTLNEAAAYSGIGVNKLREITQDKRCDFVVFVGRKRMIKRKLFEKYLEQTYSL